MQPLAATPPEPPDAAARRDALLRRIAATGAPGDAASRLLAVSKTQPAAAVAALFAAGQRAFGENYVQEAIAKQAALAGLPIEWHLIGPLQSNKAALAARHFDWVQSVDRVKLVTALAKARDPARGPLAVLVQVNLDDEDSKSGCAPDEVTMLAGEIARHPTLRLRGLMAIPKPWDEEARRVAGFDRLRAMFDELRTSHATVDTLSVGMSHDFEAALRHGATLVRIGTALFGARPRLD